MQPCIVSVLLNHGNISFCPQNFRLNLLLMIDLETIKQVPVPLVTAFSKKIYSLLLCVAFAKVDEVIAGQK